MTAARCRSQKLSAIRKLALEAADNGLMKPEAAAGIARIRGVKRRGVRVGNWLGNAPPATLKGKRDRAILALMIGCGLRLRVATPPGVIS